MRRKGLLRHWVAVVGKPGPLIVMGPKGATVSGPCSTQWGSWWLDPYSSHMPFECAFGRPAANRRGKAEHVRNSSSKIHHVLFAFLGMATWPPTKNDIRLWRPPLWLKTLSRLQILKTVFKSWLGFWSFPRSNWWKILPLGFIILILQRGITKSRTQEDKPRKYCKIIKTSSGTLKRNSQTLFAL